MSIDKDLITVHVNVDIPTAALQSIVANIKAVVGVNEKGHYQVDTAEAVGKLIGKFIDEHEFDAYAADPAHYPKVDVKQRFQQVINMGQIFFCFLVILKGAAVAATFSWPASPNPQTIPLFHCRVENRFPHDTLAFTQGLVFENGFLLEGTGLYGRSDLRKVDLTSGKVLERTPLPQHLFGEGVAIFGEQIYQLTWRSHEVRVYERKTFNLRQRLFWPYQGWGITPYNHLLAISNGTETLFLVEPESFKIKSQLAVKVKGNPVQRLNELETVGPYILANVWQTSRIAVILPKSGHVAAWIDLSTIAKNEPAGVANGIAWGCS